MEYRGFSQQSLHRKSGVSQGKIGYILKGAQHTGLDVVHKLAEAVGLDVWQLLAPPETASTSRIQGLDEVNGLYARCDDAGRATILHVCRGQELLSLSR